MKKILLSFEPHCQLRGCFRRRTAGYRGPRVGPRHAAATGSVSMPERRQ